MGHRLYKRTTQQQTSKVFMMYTMFAIAIILSLGLPVESVSFPAPATIPGVVLQGNGDDSCPLMNDLEMARENISNAVIDILTSNAVDTLSILMPECGEGLWRQVVDFNMNIPSQQCPSACRWSIPLQ